MFGSSPLLQCSSCRLQPSTTCSHAQRICEDALRPVSRAQLFRVATSNRPCALCDIQLFQLAMQGGASIGSSTLPGWLRGHGQRAQLLPARCPGAARRAGRAVLSSSAGSAALSSCSTKSLWAQFLPRVMSECPSGALVGLFRTLVGSSPPRAAGCPRAAAPAAAPANCVPDNSVPDNSGPGDRRATALPGAAFLLQIFAGQQVYR